MGKLIDGAWHDVWYDTDKSGGRFERQESSFRNWVTRDGAPGPSADGGFAAESGRYHLYVSYACPWAHRTLIMRTLLGLEAHIDVSVVNPNMLEHGWSFEPWPGVVKDPLFDARYLYELYLKADPKATSRVTVPVLWDKTRNTMVSNESADIIRMFNDGFRALSNSDHDFYPAPHRDEIDEVNTRVYNTVNNGVYKAGFATKQEVYAEAVQELFASLDWLEDRLTGKRYLVGDRLTEADIRLFTTLARFDSVYFGHFKTNIKRIVDYPNLWRHTRSIYHLGGVAETTRFDHIKQHYYASHPTINPTRIVPVGPTLDWSLESTARS